MVTSYFGYGGSGNIGLLGPELNMNISLPSNVFSSVCLTAFGLLLCTFLYACSGQNSKQPGVEPVQSQSETLVYECSGTEFIARINEGGMAVWFEDKHLLRWK